MSLTRGLLITGALLVASAIRATPAFADQLGGLTSPFAQGGPITTIVMTSRVKEQQTPVPKAFAPATRFLYCLSESYCPTVAGPYQDSGTLNRVGNRLTTAWRSSLQAKERPSLSTIVQSSAFCGFTRHHEVCDYVDGAIADLKTGHVAWPGVTAEQLNNAKSNPDPQAFEAAITGTLLSDEAAQLALNRSQATDGGETEAVSTPPADQPVPELLQRNPASRPGIRSGTGG